MALGPAAGHHSESGHKGAADTPSCPLHRGGQGPTELAEPGLHQQPEPCPSPWQGHWAGGQVPYVPGRHAAPHAPVAVSIVPAAEVMPGELLGQPSPDETRWVQLRGLQACTHRQHGPRRRGPARLSRAEAVVGEGSALVPVTPPSPGSQSPGAPGVFGRQETPPQSCPGRGGASSLTRRRGVGGQEARARGC